MSKFKNTYVSYSRLSRFEQCPLSFKFHYIDKRKSEPGLPLIFGSAVHTVLEKLYQEAVEEGGTVKLSEERALELWRQQCIEVELTGLEAFEEGNKILKSYISKAEPVVTADVIGIEQEFNFSVGEFEFKGFIDRIDRISDDTIEIIDYKTNRMMFTRSEVDTSLQLSIYHAAVQKLYPWAKNIKLSFEMLRHGARLTTERLPEQIVGALSYAETLAQMSEQVPSYRPRLNNNCVYCDHSAHCSEYKRVIETDASEAGEDLTSIEAISAERERLAQVTKILYARKKKLDEMIRTRLEDCDRLEVNGMVYRVSNTQTKQYPLLKALGVLTRHAEIDREEILNAIATVDKKAVERFLKDIKSSVDKSVIALIKAELNAISEVKFTPRLTAKKAEF